MSGQEYLNLGERLQKNAAFEIAHAAWSKAAGMFNIDVKASKMLLPNEMEAVKRLICEKLQTDRVNIHFDFKDAVKGFFSSSDTEAVDFFISSWSQINPELYPVFANSDIRANSDESGNTVFSVNAPSSLIKAISQERVNTFRNAASSIWDWHFSTKHNTGFLH